MNELFNNMTKEEAIEYSYKHQKDYDHDVGQREFDCLIACLESGHIKPNELPDYGMDYEQQLPSPIEDKSMKTIQGTVHFVKYNGEDYIRFGHDNWFISMGEAYEPVYRSEDLEKVFIETSQNKSKN